jgi:hypothetical protein
MPLPPLPKSGIHIPRQSVVGSEGLWTKMFDPPNDSPETPEFLDLTQIGLSGTPTNPKIPVGVRANPVPSVMQAAGMMDPEAPYTIFRSLMHGETRPTWDGGAKGGKLEFFLFADDKLKGDVPDLADPGILNNPSTAPIIAAKDPQFPAPTYRSPRGAICQNFTHAKGPPPHTIHWHGIEPTPMNDGVGHCSFEIQGHGYTYQWQPNFIGTYFYHCHRNTMQHFEFGLAGIMPFSPPDAWFASIATILDDAAGTVTLNNVPFGAGFDGKFRTAANLDSLPRAVRKRFPGYVPGNPVQGVNVPDPGRDPIGQFKFLTDPWAYTVPYDVEAIWVLDDRSSQWSDFAPSAFATFPEFGTIPGFNDSFTLRADANVVINGVDLGKFFAFNDFNADYWYITGVPIAAAKGSKTFVMPTGLLYPSLLNSGQGAMAGLVPGTFTEDPALQTRIDIKAGLGQTVLVRSLNAAYNSTRVTFPLDVVIIEWDGRALGVPPLSQYNRPIQVRAGTPFTMSTARRYGLIMNSTRAVNDVAKVEFLDTRSSQFSTSGPLTLTGGGEVLLTFFIPIKIG